MVYKRNFLTKVIFRIDFDQIKLGKIGNFSEKIKDEFPNSEEGKAVEGEVNFDFKTKEVKQSSNQFLTWTFLNKERTKKIIIHPNFLSLEYDKYTDSLELLNDISKILIFITSFEINTINRIGLRYVNEIKLEEKELLGWSEYFDKSLLGSIEFVVKQKKVLARAMSQLIIKEDFGNINLNYGVWNSNFPNEVIDKSFILDLDAYSKFPLSTEGLDLVGLVKNYNKKIENLFESIIKEKFRLLLNK